jgi:hypothetical protein
MPTGRNEVMLCYALKQTHSASQPFVLEPTKLIEKKDENGKVTESPSCTSIDATHPLLQRQTVVLVIDAQNLTGSTKGRGGNMSRIKVLNLNLTSTAATPLNSAPLRPSISTASVAAVQSAALNSVYYFRWPVQLTGDTIPTLTVNAVYLAPAPGDPWAHDTAYTAGSVVTPVVSNGHFYTATLEGRSGATQPTFTNATPAQVMDPATAAAGTQLTWMDLGIGVPQGVAAASITSWSPYKQYTQGAVILNPINSHYYTAIVGGFSGNTMPVFPVKAWLSVSETAAVLSWRHVGPAPKTPPSPAPGFWTPNTPYSVGQIIQVPGATPTHYYIATTAGQSGATIPPFAPGSGPIADTSSPLPPLTWTDLGTGTPPGVPPAAIAAWAPAKQFAQGTVILYPNNGHFYVASVGGVSGNVAPVFPVTPPGPVVAESLTGAVTWEDAGTTAPSGSPTTLPQWTPSTYFATGQVISDADNGHFYLARVGGQSGTTMPSFLTTVKAIGSGSTPDGEIFWQDSGTVAPASVASAGPTDQVVSLLNFVLPQVHSLYYFNLATGFAASWVRNPSFIWTSTPPATGSAPGTAQKVRGSLTEEPILLFTTYFPGLAFDAESPWKPKDLIPGFSFGLSLSNPANSFYLGLSSEIWRNLQVAGGLNIGRINALAPGLQEQSSTNSPGPSTVQRFAKGAFVGVTLNLDFIAGLFGAKI